MNRAVRLVYHGGRLILGGVFFYAGVVKAADVVTFAGEVANYRLLPYQGNYLVAATLPYVELLIGALLLVNRRVRPAALLAMTLTLVFMGALASAIARGMDIDCGCFQPAGAGQAGPWAALARDAGLLVLAAAVFRLRERTVQSSR